MKIDDIGEIDGRKWIRDERTNYLRPYTCCISRNDNQKYQLGGIEMFGDNTYIVEFTEDEFKNWKRTKMVDQMLG